MIVPSTVMDEEETNNTDNSEWASSVKPGPWTLDWTQVNFNAKEVLVSKTRNETGTAPIITTKPKTLKPSPNSAQYLPNSTQYHVLLLSLQCTIKTIDTSD